MKRPPGVASRHPSQARIDTRASGEGGADGLPAGVQFGLSVFEGPDVGARLILTKTRVAVGAGVADLKLRDAAVGESRFTVEVSGLDARLHNPGRADGVRVNGHPVSDTFLHDRDEIRIGGDRIVFTVASMMAHGVETIPVARAVAPDGTVLDAPLAARVPTAGQLHQVRLEVIEGRDAGTVFDLSRADVYRVGRRRGEIPLMDVKCSGAHAQLEVLGHGECYLEDLRSTNGTFVNERSVTRTRLTDGDVIRIGGTRLRFTNRQAEDDAGASDLD